MTGPGQPAAPTVEGLRERLEPFGFDEASALPDGFAVYTRYYGIDFASRMPVVHRAGTLESEAHSLVLQYWAPEHPEGTVFIVHGYFDHVGIYGHPIEYFLRKNFAVMSYDQPGHGLSSGARASIEHFSSYVDALERVIQLSVDACPGPWHVLGQSMGGAITMTYLLRASFPGGDNPFREVVLLAPLVYPKGWAWGRVFHLLLHRMVESRPRTFATNSHDPDFVEFVQTRDPLQPRELPLAWVGALKRWITEFDALPPSAVAPVVIQGTGDDTVDWPVNMDRIATKFPSAITHYITGARHHLVNESAELRAKIFDLLDDRF